MFLPTCRGTEAVLFDTVHTLSRRRRQAELSSRTTAEEMKCNANDSSRTGGSVRVGEYPVDECGHADVDAGQSARTAQSVGRDSREHRPDAPRVAEHQTEHTDPTGPRPKEAHVDWPGEQTNLHSCLPLPAPESGAHERATGVAEARVGRVGAGSTQAPAVRHRRPAPARPLRRAAGQRDDLQRRVLQRTRRAVRCENKWNQFIKISFATIKM